MKIINNYSELQISQLQHVRLYLQSRPLAGLYRKRQKNIRYDVPEFANLIDQEINSNYIAVDCAGWYFSNSIRPCTAIELSPVAKLMYNNIAFEYDYLSWRPTYLDPVPVLAYYPVYFKYCPIDDFINFCNIWGTQHSKLIIGLDPTKIKFNYLKFNLLHQVKCNLQFDAQIKVLIDQPFDLLFTICPL